MNFSVIPTNLSSKTTKISIIRCNAVCDMKKKRGSSLTNYLREFSKKYQTAKMSKIELRYLKQSDSVQGLAR